MKIEEITIHNFRSIKHQTLRLKDYSLLIGANNSGKTNTIDALRIFWEDEKYQDEKDFPKFPTNDQESWIEIEFKLTDDEFKSLKKEYRLPDNRLKLRKYLKHPEKVKTNQSNIYAYEGGKLSDNLFYGLRSIKGKFGNIIYIPAVTKIDEFTKLTGPSTFRNLLEFVIKKVIKNSPSFKALSKSFSEFNETFREEASKDGLSLNSLISDINNDIKDWDVKFNVKINEIKPEEIIKNLISHHFEDKNLQGQTFDVSSFGQGLQRYFIYTLIKLSAKYKENPATNENKIGFLPDLTLILFEEPEAFLHPTQQEILNLSLKEISSLENQQVLISTHSAHFVSKNIEDITSLIKLSKNGAETIVYQISDTDLQEILKENKEIKEILGEEIKEEDLELESIRYSLYLDPDRCSSFFSDRVLICEGLSEKALIDYLIKERKLILENSKIYTLNAAGKYDIHRYMNLFGKLGIKHSVLFDGDNNRDRHRKINEFIEKHRNTYTLKLHQFEGEFEDFLCIKKVSDRYKKPLNVMWHYLNNKIEAKKIDELIEIINDLII